MPTISDYLSTATQVTGTIRLKAHPEEESLDYFVLQRVEKGSGNIPTNRKHDMQLRRHVIPYDPKTPTQIAGRARIRAATQAWHQMGEEERQVWRDKAKKLVMTGFNLHIRQYCRAHPLSEFLPE